MNNLSLFGILDSVILGKSCSTKGTVTAVKRCWWIKINTQPIRLYASHKNTAHPYIITFQYSVDSILYTGKRFVGIQYRVPQIGETFRVYFDPSNPRKYACYAFGPGTTQIKW